MVSKSDEVWPEWPQGAKGQRMVDTEVACSPDELFLLLWEPKSPYVAKSQEVLGNKDFKETAWCGSLEDLEGGKQGSPPKDAWKAAEYRGKFRKNSSSGTGMGLKYINVELQRCLQAVEGGPFEVEVIVQTTATYGERFRPIIKHRIEGKGPGKCTYTVDYALVYIASTNGLLKKAIERGATNGITRNFQVLLEVLGTFKDTGGSAAAPNLHVELPASREAQLRVVEVSPRWWNSMVAAESIQGMQAPTDWLLRKTGLAGVVGGGKGGASHALAAAAVALLVSLLLFILRSLSSMCGMLPGSMRRSCHFATASLDLPSSSRQVFCAAALLLLANRMLAVLLHLLPTPSPSESEGAQAAPATPLATDNDHPSSGIKYDGFERSLESAEANILEGEGALKRRNRSLGSMAAEAWQNGAVTQRRRDQLKQGLRTGFKNLVDVTKWQKREEKPGARPSRTEPPSPAVSPPPFGAYPSGPSVLPPTDRQAGRAAAKATQSGGSERAARAASDASAVLSDEGENRLESGSAAEVSSRREGSSRRADGQKEGGGIRDFLKPGSILDKSEEAMSSMFGNWSSTTSRSHKSTIPTPTSQAVKKDAAAEYQDQEEAGGQVVPVAELAVLDSSDLDEDTGPVEEEVFENERYQPFRAWGHTWPGHFLPTDRVGHWSVEGQQQNPPLNSASFDAIAPALKKGWEWKEEGWQIDMRGLLENAVDEEGWAYATDFSWMQWPPKPGQGRFKRVRDYVRRRRWHRTRIFSGIPLQDSPPSKLPLARLPSPVAAPAASLLSQSLASSPAATSAQQEDASPSKIPKPRQPRRSTELNASSHGSDSSLLPPDGPQATAGSPPAGVPSSAPGEPTFSRDPNGQSASRKDGEGSAHGSSRSLGQPSSSRSMGPAGAAPRQEGEGSSISRESSLSSRGEGGRLESRLAGWKERLSRSHGSSRDQGEDVERKGSGGDSTGRREAEGTRRRFARGMNDMFSAATHGLRTGTTKKESAATSSEPLARRPSLVRESTPQASSQGPPLAMKRSGSGSLQATAAAPPATANTADLATFFGLPAAGQDRSRDSDTTSRAGSAAASIQPNDCGQAGSDADEAAFQSSRIPAPSGSATPTHRAAPDKPSEKAASPAAVGATPPSAGRGSPQPDTTPAAGPPRRGDAGGQAPGSRGEGSGNSLVRQKTAEHPLEPQELPPAESSSDQASTGIRNAGGEVGEGVGEAEEASSVSGSERTPQEPKHLGVPLAAGEPTGPSPRDAGGVDGAVEAMSDTQAAMVLESAFSGSLMQAEGWDSDGSLHIPEDPAELLAQMDKRHPPAKAAPAVQGQSPGGAKSEKPADD